jgi:precorrin-4/cobalt-precorrin-4 C11-methyltransferase
MAGRTPVPEAEALESLARHRASMAIYLSITMIDRVTDVLKNTYGEDAPAAVAYRVSQPEERIFHTTVAGLPDLVKQENIRKTALIIVGEALGQDSPGPSHKTRLHKSRLYDKAFTHEYRTGEA